MTVRRLGLLFAAAAMTASAQNGPPIEIHGVVSEIGLHAGLAGAQVTLYEFVGPSRVRTPYAAVAADRIGEFRFHPERFGTYWVEVKKEGYFASIPVDGPYSTKPPAAETGTLITVSAAHPSQEVRFALMRPGQLEGSVVGDEDKPLRNMLVEVTNALSPSLSRATLHTDADGRFSAKMLMPGDYLVKVSSPASKFMSAPPKFQEGDLNTADEELQTVHWPGGLEPEAAAPVRVSPGATTSLAVIRMRKTPSYRAHVSIEGCRAADRPLVRIAAASGAAESPFVIPPQIASCEDLLIRGLKPGSYVFQLIGPYSFASEPVEIANKNVEVRLVLKQRADTTGRVLASDGSPFAESRRAEISDNVLARPAPSNLNVAAA